MATETPKVKPPKLADLKSRECSPAELQAALVQVIGLHNDLVKEISDLKHSGRIQSSRDAMMNRTYGL